MRRRFAAAVALAAAVTSAIGAEEPASRWFTTSDHVRLHVLEAGLRDGRSPVVAFVPGWSMPASVFRPQFAALGERHPVAALDPRGQGLSEVPAGGYAIGRRAQDIAEFVARYPRVVLVGWSLGALEALEYVHVHGAGTVQALVLVDSSVGEDPPPPGASGFVAELNRDRPAALEDFVRGMFRSPRPDAEVRALRDQAMRMPLAASLSLFPSAVPREHWRQIARAVRVPMLYAVTPPLAAQAENLRRARPATRIEVFADAGHALFVDAPDRFNRMLESLLADTAER